MFYTSYDSQIVLHQLVFLLLQSALQRSFQIHKFRLRHVVNQSCSYHIHFKYPSPARLPPASRHALPVGRGAGFEPSWWYLHHIRAATMLWQRIGQEEYDFTDDHFNSQFSQHLDRLSASRRYKETMINKFIKSNGIKTDI